jgi:Protein of unknown function (DUF2798)
MKNPSPFPRILRQILPDLFILPTVAALLSGIMTWANVGFADEFMGRWARSFGVSLVMLPLILVGIGVLQKWLDQTLHFVHSLARKVLASLLIACVIETVLAVGVTAISHPLDAQFAQAWWLAFSRSLPAGVLVGLFMTFFLKPRMDRMRRAAA